MKIAIAGGSGFIGKHLADALLKEGHEVFILTRSRKNSSNGIQYVQWMSEGTSPESELKDTDVFINLAGKSINTRWTEQAKKEIIDSRVKAARETGRILSVLESKPATLINASAVGAYGADVTQSFTEDSPVADEDFLSHTVRIWEEEAKNAAAPGMRTVLCRFGIILDQHDGALPPMLLPYKLFAGGTVGSGEQWLSWIHIQDVVKLILFVIQEESIEGPVNFTSPNPVQMKEFGKTIAKVTGKPHWLPAPSFAINTLMGEMSDLILKGQRVLPKKALEHGYSFHFPDLEHSLKNIIK
ncbi:TIGR01777 family protein [Bacillus lacus]|uniref:TIGR01777 family protein n=1 Tax=Metabacillus lacus TaxID=1983721 RepID=A0A7X2J2I1_9BACI|nr:TIGR01777 family oxidoreductase [Metabacillus lacus]MRX73902.1 TIGR01777 family protein [Metabacillus lacus]